MQIKILNVNPVETKQGPKKQYRVFKLDYAVDQNSRSKDINEFSDVFKTLKVAQPGEFYEIESEKKGEFVNWTKATKVNGVQDTTTNTSSTGAKRQGTWETPEERAARQIMIVRQSNIASAVALLVGFNDAPSEEVPVDRVLSIAKKFENYVFDVPSFQEESVDNEGVE